MRTVFFSVAVLTISVALSAAELPGYPYDVLSKKDSQYQCTEATQYPKEAGGILYELCVDKSFSPMADNIARQAFEELVQRLLSEKTYQCFKRAPTAGLNLALKSHPEFLARWVTPALSARALAGVAPGSEAFSAAGMVFISALSAGESWLAEGYWNYFDNKLFAAQGRPWRRHISLAASLQHLGSPTVPFGNDVRVWTALLGTAYFKNMGLEETPLSMVDNPLHFFTECLLQTGPAR